MNKGFVISVFGTHYMPFVSVLVNSIISTNPECKIYLIWDDISDLELKLFCIIYPKVQLIQMSHEKSFKNVDKQISLKMNHWYDFLNSNLLDQICFLDCDILVNRNLDCFFDVRSDFIFTVKNEAFPLNTGVVFCKNKNNAKTFFKKWVELTHQIISDSCELEKARQIAGGADQYALYKIVNQTNFIEGNHYMSDFNLNISFISCSILNETRSVPYNDSIYIFHLKGGWHSILLKHTDFTENRPYSTSKDLYDKWIYELNFFYAKQINLAIQNYLAKVENNFMFNNFTNKNIFSLPILFFYLKSLNKYILTVDNSNVVKNILTICALIKKMPTMIIIKTDKHIDLRWKLRPLDRFFKNGNFTFIIPTLRDIHLIRSSLSITKLVDILNYLKLFLKKKIKQYVLATKI